LGSSIRTQKKNEKNVIKTRIRVPLKPRKDLREKFFREEEKKREKDDRGKGREWGVLREVDTVNSQGGG